jgi:hypothetical protein
MPRLYGGEVHPSSNSGFLQKTIRNCPVLLLSRHFSFRQRLACKLTRTFELWQTECLYGTVFALRVSLVPMPQARRKNRAGDSNPARN